MSEKIEIVQKKFDKLRKLSLKDFENTDKDIKDFLKNFLVTYNKEKATIVKQSKRAHTPKAKTRSLGDIYRITKSYFPDTTLKEVLTIITDFEYISGHYCPDIHKQVYFIGNDFNELSCHSSRSKFDNGFDENGINIKPYLEKSKNYCKYVEWYEL